jgi:hypothetical protein
VEAELEPKARDARKAVMVMAGQGKYDLEPANPWPRGQPFASGSNEQSMTLQELGCSSTVK